jgi:7TM diverse intracellular signalling.
VILWTIFALWRGAAVPPLSHDALSYHLPKAVLFARAHAYEYLDQLNVIPRKLPSNYELMLADVIVTTGSDRITEWLSTFHYILFIIAGTALVQRWWGSNPKRDAIVALLIAQIPVALLQSSAHKNDLLLAFLVVSALMWGARFAATGETPSEVLMIVAMAMAVGTKPQAAFTAVALVPFVIWRFWRERNGRRFFAFAGASILALALLGGASYVIDFKHELTSPAARENGNMVTTFGFNDLANIWQAPYVLVAAPFSRDDLSLYVPWQARPWFWRRYEIYFSHLGIGFSLALLALPFAIVKLRRERSLERVVGSVVALVAFVAMLPVVTIPHGLYTISLPRYALFIVPAVLGWSVEAAVRSRERVARIALLACSGLFVVYAIDNAVNDGFAPLRYVIWASHNPGTRLVPFSPNRAPCLADRIAGPDDKIAIDAGFSSWIYPAFGRGLTRPVQLLSGSGPLNVDADARWIVIDRGYDEAWNKPSFRDLSQVSRLPTRGSVPPAGQTLLRQALALPGFRPVFVNASGGQAVFVRK